MSTFVRPSVCYLYCLPCLISGQWLLDMQNFFRSGTAGFHMATFGVARKFFRKLIIIQEV